MAKLLEIKDDVRQRWHQDTAEQGQWLGMVVRGFFAYHAVPTNTRALSGFRYHVIDLWRRALRRRSQRDRTTQKSMKKLANRWLPKPRISHPWPSQRFRVKQPKVGEAMREGVFGADRDPSWATRQGDGLAGVDRMA